MTKVYVINEIGFMYNDEDYYTTDAEDGTPKVAYLNKQKAQDACDKLNFEKFKIEDMDYYAKGTKEFYKVYEVELED